MASPIKSGRIFGIRASRRAAAVFLCAGLLVGAFDAPGYVNRGLERVGLSFAGDRLSRFERYFPYRLGLDIQGGAHLVYQADVSALAPDERSDAMSALRDVIERRVNLFGVVEPVVQIQERGGERRLIVEIAGVSDISAAIRLIGETPYLEFREERPEQERNQMLERREKGETLFEDPYFVPTPLTGRFLRRADLEFDPLIGQPTIGLELTAEGAELFAELTKRNIGKSLAIYLDGAPISAPVVQHEITGGRAQITGQFTPQSAKELAGRLNSGALPVPISLVSQQSVGPSLGRESLERSFTAAVLGFLAVAVFMVLWYRLPGVLSVLALLLYVAAVLAVFKIIPVTLTVAGIAGFILSIGMAVDANILIFERMKEELRSGKSLEEGIREGFSRAWTSIRDSNASSLITASILYWIGTGTVQGFAFTLALGVLMSMLSAISVTRTFLLALAGPRLSRARFFFLSGFSL